MPLYADGFDQATFCYAAKKHPQFTGDGQLAISYVCDLATRGNEDPFEILRRLAETMNIYRLETVPVPLPEFD